VPAGVMIEVRLQSSISSATSHAGDPFSAVLDHPITVDDETIVPAGAHVSGRVVTAKRAHGPGQPGFLRLTLSGITIGETPVPIESSSTFARGKVHQQDALPGTTDMSEVRMMPERRLSFRLARPLLVQVTTPSQAKVSSKRP
jgi:hypothetical protein